MPSTYYVSKGVGSDLNPGTLVAPFATIAKAKTVRVAGDSVFLDGGDSFTGQHHYLEELEETLDGVSWTAYGYHRPIVNGSVATTGFVLDSGSIWKKTGVATDPLSMYFVLTDGSMAKGVSCASRAAVESTPFGFFYDGGAQEFCVNAAANPATAYREVRLCALQHGLFVNGADDVTVTHIGFIGQRGSAANCQSGANFRLRYCWVGWCSEDGAGGGGAGATGSVIEYCLIEAAGQKHGSVVILSPGDGVSWHAGSTGVVRYCTIRNNLKAGLDSVEDAQIVHHNCTLSGNYANLLAFNSGGSNTFYNLLVVVSATDGGGIAANGAGGCFAYGCTFVGPGTGTALIGATIVTSATLQSCIFVNFGVGILKLGGTLTEDHNCLGGNGAAASGHTPHASDVTADPQLRSIATGDYRLKAASPCRGAGLDLSGSGVTVDFCGRPRPAAPDIGALQFFLGREGALTPAAELALTT